MEQPSQSPRWFLPGVTIACLCGSLYLVLVWLGVAPAPGELHGPGWFLLALAAMLAALGASLGVRELTGMDDSQGDVPENAPRWVKAVYSLSAVVIVAALALIGTWVAFGPGDRHFSMSGFFVGSVGENIGRAVFGFGTILSWLIVIAFARNAMRKIFGKPN